MARALINTINPGNITKNYIINGRFDHWQRGTSFSLSGTQYTADRWYALVSAANRTVSRVGGTGTGSIYGLKLQRVSGSDTTACHICQPFETTQFARLRGKKVNISFLAKCGTTFSASGSLIEVFLATGNGTESKYIGGGFSGTSTILDTFPVLTTTLTRYSLTTTAIIPTDSTQMELVIRFTPVGTAGVDDSITLEQVMIAEGVEDPGNFSLAGATPQGELAFCQRYFCKTYDLDTAPGSVDVSGSIAVMSSTGTATFTRIFWGYPVRLRSVPALTLYNTSTGAAGSWRNSSGGDTVVLPTSGGTGGTQVRDNAGLADGSYMLGHIVADAEI